MNINTMYQTRNLIRILNYEKRVDFANKFLSLTNDAKNFFIRSDEAYFYLTLPVNKHNNRNWSDSYMFEGIKKHLHDLVWYTKKKYEPHKYISTITKKC